MLFSFLTITTIFFNPGIPYTLDFKLQGVEFYGVNTCVPPKFMLKFVL